LLLLTCLALLLPGDGAAAQTVPSDAKDRELIIGTKLAPPFAMKDRDGKWTGISIELWDHVANRLKLKYRYVEEPTVQGLIDKTAEKASTHRSPRSP
jgi:polar amino acid transport system substrate-binding protein